MIYDDSWQFTEKVVDYGLGEFALLFYVFIII